MGRAVLLLLLSIGVLIVAPGDGSATHLSVGALPGDPDILLAFGLVGVLLIFAGILIILELTYTRHPVAIGSGLLSIGLLTIVAGAIYVGRSGLLSGRSGSFELYGAAFIPITLAASFFIFGAIIVFIWGLNSGHFSEEAKYAMFNHLMDDQMRDGISFKKE